MSEEKGVENVYARAWCSIHECNPSECFVIHYPTAYRNRPELPRRLQEQRGEMREQSTGDSVHST
jgi:hypothetical protein